MATALSTRSTAARPNRVLRYLRAKGFAYLCLLPILAATAALVYYPLVYGISLSFTNASDQNLGFTLPNGVSFPNTYRFVGLKNFADIFTSKDPNPPGFGQLMTQTFVWILLNAVFHFTIGLGLALLLNRKMRFRGVYRALMIIPWATPQFVAAFAWKYMFNTTNGIINRVLTSIHLPAVNWSTDAKAAMTAVIIANVWLGIPFMTITLLGGLQTIPTELYEVAQIDGANWFQRFWNITLPLLRPVAVLITMLDVIWTFNIFAVIFLITGGSPAGGSDTLVTHAFNVAIGSGFHLYGLGAAYGVVILVILLIFVSVYSRLLKANQGVY
jgi:arabinogalactan oligomer/maltooligosaccharide transport system permease protein